MPQRDDLWLRAQQRRFMRPDACRYIRPDAARFLKPGTDPAEVYPALALKYQGQPRLPLGEGGGQFTFGRMNGETESGSGRPRVYIDTTDWDNEIGGESDVGNDGDFWSGLQLAGDLPPGIGDNGGPSLDEPPEIPKQIPKAPGRAMAFVRAAAAWILRIGRKAPVVDAFLGALAEVEEIDRLASIIKTANDPPQTEDELRKRVAQTSRSMRRFGRAVCPSELWVQLNAAEAAIAVVPVAA